MNSRSIPLLVIIPTALTAQMASHVAPLKHWPAPLYWQPTEAESRATSNWAAQKDAAGNTPTAQSPANSLVFVAMTPCRVLDTRTGSGFTGAFGPPSLVGGVSRTFPMQSSATCTIPSIAQAYSFNVTVIPPGFLGFLTVYPTGQPLPNASTLNDATGLVLANAAVVAAGTSGSVDVFANNNTDVIIDINGYYAPQTGITLVQGTAAVPSLSFAGDAGTGIFSSGAGVLNFATGGTNRLTVRSDGDVDLPGSIRKNGTLFLHNLGSFNTGVGLGALATDTTGDNNTAVGANALGQNTTGEFNTAIGGATLFFNTTGHHNTASGYNALVHNTTGSSNTASGALALFSNTTGDNNTASGDSALYFNTTGPNNTAVGLDALFSNTTGGQNTAIGFGALASNTTASDNIAIGHGALSNNTTGNGNTATGAIALRINTTGGNNTASGFQTLAFNTTGGNNTASGVNSLQLNATGNFNVAAGVNALASNASGSNNTANGYGALQNAIGDNNTALGWNAGVNLTTGTENIVIGNIGTSGDDHTIRVGDTQTTTIIAGIRDIATGVGNAVTVVIDGNGQLGTISSSRRFKEDVTDMGQASSGLLRLRPVTYRYKQPYADGSKPLDYGLIAEEVADVYPDLVVKNKDGQIETVQYQKLTPMLLNELQKQAEQIRQQGETIHLLEARFAAMEALSSRAPATTRTGQ